MILRYSLVLLLWAFPVHAQQIFNPVEDDASTAAPSDAQFWVAAPNGTLTAEKDLSGFTGLVLNTTGTPSQYPGTACTNQVLRLLDTSGAGTCITITSAYVDSSIVPSTRNVNTTAPLAGGGALSGDLTLTTSMATSRLLGRVTAGTGVAEELTGTQATTLLDVFTSGLKGLVPASGGGTTNFLRADGNWVAPGGVGSANVVSVTVDFGTSGGSNHVKTVVTGQAWVTTTSVIVCSPTGFATADRPDGAEDAAIEGLIVSVSERVNGTGFTLNTAPIQWNALGKYIIGCTGA